MSSSNGTTPIPPFVEDETKGRQATARGLDPVALIVMAIAWVVLTITLVGGATVLWNILVSQEYPTGAGVGATAAALAIAFAVGWVASLVSIRSLRNTILPNVIRVYMAFIVAGMVIVYLRVVYKLFIEAPNIQYSRYTIVLGSLFVVLAGLHLLLEDHNVFPYAYPLLIAGVIHVLGIVVHYVFMVSSPNFIGYDIAFLLYNLVLAGLLVANLVFLKWIQPLMALLPVRGARA